MSNPLFLTSEVNPLNDAVNISLCTGMSKFRTPEEGSPNWSGVHDAPSIKFKGCDIEWVYENEKDRDKEYATIIAAYSDEYQ